MPLRNYVRAVISEIEATHSGRNSQIICKQLEDIAPPASSEEPLPRKYYDSMQGWFQIPARM